MPSFLRPKFDRSRKLATGLLALSTVVLLVLGPAWTHRLAVLAGLHCHAHPLAACHSEHFHHPEAFDSHESAPEHSHSHPHTAHGQPVANSVASRDLAATQLIANVAAESEEANLAEARSEAQAVAFRLSDSHQDCALCQHFAKQLSASLLPVALAVQANHFEWACHPLRGGASQRFAFSPRGPPSKA